MKVNLPVGSEIWTVIESLSDRWFSGEPFHYEVVRGKVVGIFLGGYTEYQVSTTNRKGHNSILMYLRTGMYGKTYFGTEQEAIALAEKKTSALEKIWGKQLPRPWRKLEISDHKPDWPGQKRGQKMNRQTVQWIPCSEELPERYENVLVTLEGGKDVIVACYGSICKEDSWFNEGGGCFKMRDVIAWMPFPDPYKGGENG